MTTRIYPVCPKCRVTLSAGACMNRICSEFRYGLTVEEALIRKLTGQPLEPKPYDQWANRLPHQWTIAHLTELAEYEHPEGTGEGSSEWPWDNPIRRAK